MKIINNVNSIILINDNTFGLNDLTDNDIIKGAITRIPNASPVHQEKKICIIGMESEKKNNVNVPINALKDVLTRQENIKNPVVSFTLVKVMYFVTNFLIKKAPVNASSEFPIKNKMLI